MEFSKISSPSLHELFVNQLENLILSGQLGVGEKLPPERQLSEQMQVSRAVVNSGLSELAAKGFLVIKPRSGTYVADYRRNGTVDTLLAVMKYNGGHLRNDEIRSIFEFRLAIDTLLVRLCAKRLTDENLLDLFRIVNEMKDATDVNTAIDAAFRFQHELALMSGNSLVPLIIQSFKAPTLDLWHRFTTLYGIDLLYRNNLRTWEYLNARDVEGGIAWVDASVHACIDGETQIYYN